MAERVVTLVGGVIPKGLVERAAGIVREGGVLVHPTATIHGLGCRYDMPAAVERIRLLKGRDADKPMILLVNSSRWLDKLCREVPPEAYAIAEKFWPGPVTLVLRVSEAFRVTCSWPAETVALRHCAHPFAAALLERVKIPFVSTSLNLSGETSPGDSAEYAAGIFRDFPPEIAPELAVIDPALDKPGRPASSLVDLSTPGEFRLLRPGPVPADQLERAGGFTFEKS